MQIRKRADMAREDAIMLLETTEAEVEVLRQQMAEKDDIIKHQARLNESAHAEIGRLRHALECAVASMESGVTSLGAIRLAHEALQGDSNG